MTAPHTILSKAHRDRLLTGPGKGRALAVKTMRTAAATAASITAGGVADTYGPDTGVLSRLRRGRKEPIRMEVRDGFHTAAWAWDHSVGHHHFVLGDGFTDMMEKIPVERPSAKQIRDHAVIFGLKLLRHEAWHAALTERGSVALIDRIVAADVPFALVNLFEDARIEHRARTAEGQRFCWTDYMTFGTAAHPTTAFAYCVMHERPVSRSVMVGTFSAEQMDKVDEFYRRACAAGSTLEIIDLAREWVAYWEIQTGNALAARSVSPAAKHRTSSDDAPPGVMPPMPTPKSEAPPAEAGRPAPSAGGEEASEGEAPKAASTVEGPGSRREATPVATVTRSTLRRPETFMAGSSRNDAMGSPVTARIAKQMAQIVAASASPRTARLSSSGSRLHMASVASQSEQAFRAPGRYGGTPTITLVMDMSGSMSDSWEQHGATFTAAFLQLLREGTVKGQIVLTGAEDYAIVPLGISREDFSRLRPEKRSESIAATLEAIRPMVESSHMTIVYTDAEITDGAVDANRWRQRGADIIGACVVDDESSSGYYLKRALEHMREHFGSNALAPNGYALAARLASMIGAKV